MTLFAALPAIAAANRGLGARFRLADLAFVLVAGQRATTVRVRDARVSVEDGAAADVAFTLTAAEDDWAGFTAERPPVGLQTLYAMAMVDKLVLTGPRPLECLRHLMGLEMLLQGLRPKPAFTPSTPPAIPQIEPIVGRYMRLAIDGAPHRIYFEEAGEGPPLLCLHTAGSDGRQYRNVLNDPEVTSRFRVIAFDLPQHGKSSPAEGFQEQTHVLTTDSYMAAVMAFKQALGIERPVVMGCSIGGRAVLHLALRHGDEFRAAVGLQSATHAEGNTFPQLADQSVLSRPDINTQDLAAASVWSLMGPNTPPRERWETLWHYMQGEPGVFPGDLIYYFVDGDLRNGLVEPLKDQRCPVYLLTGEYDLSATPAMTADLARQIDARRFDVIPGVGHFPMSEDPAAFRAALVPVLDQILGETA